MKNQTTGFLRAYPVLVVAAACALPVHAAHAQASEVTLTAEQITFGPPHHFFGYIGQSLTIPWNESGRYVVALETPFHDHMPGLDEPADVVLLDVADGYRVIPIEKSRGWNFQQGTMFYWNPEHPETQFFFNDRDPQTGEVFTVLYDVAQRKRVREYRYAGSGVGNGGVAPPGGRFAAINYGRLARLRLVTGYRDAPDWSAAEDTPDDDGIFVVDVATGERRLIVSYRQLAEALRAMKPDLDVPPLFINHTLWSRDGSRLYFFVRGGWGDDGTKIVNTPCSVNADGTDLVLHTKFIGGHPEWSEGTEVLGAVGDRKVAYDVLTRKITRTIGTPEIIPDPSGDTSLSPDGAWLANGWKDKKSGATRYVVYRLADGRHGLSPSFSHGTESEELRVDPAPRWNRTNDQLLISAWADDNTRQLFVVRIEEGSTP